MSTYYYEEESQTQTQCFMEQHNTQQHFFCPLYKFHGDNPNENFIVCVSLINLYVNTSHHDVAVEKLNLAFKSHSCIMINFNYTRYKSLLIRVTVDSSGWCSQSCVEYRQDFQYFDTLKFLPHRFVLAFSHYKNLKLQFNFYTQLFILVNMLW